MTSSKPVLSLDQLPDEVIQQILSYLSQLDLVSLSQLNRHLNAVAGEPQLWKHLIFQDFGFCNSSGEAAKRRHDPAFHGWRELYIARHASHAETRKAVSSIIDHPLHRLVAMGKVVNHGYEVKSELLQLFHSTPSPTSILAQRYWSQSIIAILNRARALEIWNDVLHSVPMESPIEHALAGIDMFILGAQPVGDIEDTFRRLDSYVSSVRAANPDIDTQTPREKAIIIAQHLRAQHWVGIDDNRAYHAMEHQFLGYALRSQLRNSLPLLSAVIYCYVVRQFDLDAEPCSYPLHVHAVVRVKQSSNIDLDGQLLPTLTYDPMFDNLHLNSTPHELTHLYIDPFNTHEPRSLSSLMTNLNRLARGTSREGRAAMLCPADARSLLIRSAHNIIASLQTPPFDRAAWARDSDSDLSFYDAAYAALYILVMFPTSQQAMAQSMHDLKQHFIAHHALDIANYEKYMLPRLQEMGPWAAGRGQDRVLQALREEDSTPKTPKWRKDTVTDSQGDEREVVKYTVGTVFRHRRQGYVGVIFGWDGRCEMSERWIVGNGVDTLPRGRTQPFYNV